MMPTNHSIQLRGLDKATDEQLVSLVQALAQQQERGVAASDEQQELAEKAFELLQDGHNSALTAYIGSKVKNTDSADDIVVTTWTSVWLKAHQFKASSTFKSWLYSIALNKIRDMVDLESKKTWGVHASELCVGGEGGYDWMENRPCDALSPADVVCDASDLSHKKALVALAMSHLEEPAPRRMKGTQIVVRSRWFVPAGRNSGS